MLKLESLACRDLLLSNAIGKFSANDLSSHLAANPRLIIGLRGDFVRYGMDSIVPTVFYMNEAFQESTTSITASEISKDGSVRQVDLNNMESEAVVVIQVGERYRVDGYPVDEAILDIYSQQPPLQTLVNDCPIDADIINSFTAEEVNNQIVLTYDINFPNGSDVDIYITRVDGPGSITQLPDRTQSDPTVFYDTPPAGLNYEFIYEFRAIITTTNDDGDLVECSATINGGESSILRARATLNTNYPQVNTFVGEAIDRYSISYSWSPPANQPAISEYRLSVLQNGQFVEVTTISAQSPSGYLHNYIYDHGETERGKEIDMLIQYRSAGGTWLGDFIDRSYSTHRMPGWPLKYYGLRFDNNSFNAYENGENVLNGFPEIEVVISQANSSDSNDFPVPSKGYYPTTNSCLAEFRRNVTVNFVPVGQAFGDLLSCLDTDRRDQFIVTEDRFGVELLRDWNDFLIGSYIRVVMSENDEGTVQIVSGTVSSTNSGELSGKFGVREPITGGSLEIGGKSEWKDTRTYMLDYPPRNQEMTAFGMFYYEDLVVVHNGQVLGFGASIAEESTWGSVISFPRQQPVLYYEPAWRLLRDNL